jgi:hypothetical protein
MNRMLSRVAGASTLGVVLVLGALPGVAHADVTKCAYHGTDRACATNYTPNRGSFVQVCDNEEDGNGVRIEVAFNTIPSSYTQVGDGNGSKLGCGVRDLPYQIRSFSVCEEGNGCSARVYM